MVAGGPRAGGAACLPPTEGGSSYAAGPGECSPPVAINVCSCARAVSRAASGACTSRPDHRSRRREIKRDQSINPPARRRLCWPGRAWPHRRKKRPQTCRGDAPFRTSCALSYGARSSKRCVCCSEAWSSRAGSAAKRSRPSGGLRATTTTEDTLRARVATTPVRELGIAHGAHAGRRADGR